MQPSREQLNWKAFVSRKPVRFSGCLAALVLTSLVVTASWAFEEGDADAETADVGYQGILPAEVPDDLIDEEFSVLDGAWAQWSAATADDVVELYEGESRDIAGQRALLKKLRGRLNTMEKALSDSRYRSIFDSLISLQGKLARRVDLAEAILDTLELDPEQARVAGLQSRLAKIRPAVSALATYLDTIPGGSAWLGYVRSDDLNKLSVDAANLDDSIAVLKGVESKFQSKGSLADNQADFLSRPAFAKLERAVGDLLAYAATDVEPPDEETLRNELANYAEAIEQYESSGRSDDASDVREVLDVVAGLAVDGGDLIKLTTRTHYMNYNMRVILSEDILGRALYEQRTDSRPVSDYIAGASVRGTSKTTVETGVDIKPSSDGMRFDLTLNGTTRSNTASSTSQATIYSTGNHKFVASRGVHFDGDQFVLTSPGRISVYPNTRHYSASTNFDGGLFSGFARNRAISVANSRRGQSSSHARMRITEQVLPEFNTEVEKGFVDINKDFEEKWNKSLKEAGLYPNARSIRSSKSNLYMDSRIMSAEALGGDQISSTLAPGDGATIYVHESLLNAVAGKMRFAGQTMSEADTRKEIERALSEFFGTDVSFDDANSGDAKSDDAAQDASDEQGESEEADDEEEGGDSMLFVFDSVDPIRFKVDNGNVNLIIRTGLRREGKEDIPTQVITVPLTYSLDDDKITIERGSVRVVAADRSQSNFAQAGVLRKRIQSAFPPRTRDRKVSIEREGQTPFELTVAKIRALNGWVVVWLD